MDRFTEGLVSIIIPTYNRANYICEAIESCLAQTYKHIEIIVIDDGSTDDTRAILNEYIENNKIRYLYQENSERSVARNNGIRNACGEFIQFLDSDDIIHKTKLEKQVKYLAENRSKFGVYCITAYFEGSVDQVVEVSSERRTGNLFRRLIGGNFIPINSMLTRKADVFFDTTLSLLEDWDYWLNVSLSGKKFGHINEALSFVRRHDGITCTDQKIIMDGEVRVLEKLESAKKHLGKIRYCKFERLNSLGRKEEALKNIKAAACRDIKYLAKFITYYMESSGFGSLYSKIYLKK